MRPPAECVYCTYPLVEGRTVRARPAVDVADEMEEMHARDGIRAAYIVDSQFNYPPDHARAVCEELIERRDRCRIGWTCMANPKFVDAELALLMRAARCVSVDLSVESASDEVLAKLGKNFSAADVRRAIEALNGARLPFVAWILLGGPGETPRTVTDTLDVLERANVREALFAIGLRICPGTSLVRTAIDEGALDPGESLLTPRFYLSMDAGEIVSLVRARLVAHPGWRIAALAASPGEGSVS